jgi:hypothetical protein
VKKEAGTPNCIVLKKEEFDEKNEQVWFHPLSL